MFIHFECEFHSDWLAFEWLFGFCVCVGRNNNNNLLRYSGRVGGNRVGIDLDCWFDVHSGGAATLAS